MGGDTGVGLGCLAARYDPSVMGGGSPSSLFRAASNDQFRRSGGRYKDALPAAPVQKQLYSTASLPEGGRRRLVPHRQASATDREEDVA